MNGLGLMTGIKPWSLRQVSVRMFSQGSAKTMEEKEQRMEGLVWERKMNGMEWIRALHVGTVGNIRKDGRALSRHCAFGIVRARVRGFRGKA